MGLYKNLRGEVVEVDDVWAQAQGYTPYTPTELHQQLQQNALEARGEERGALGAVQSALTGLASGATLGLSDLALASAWTDNEREQVAAEIQSNPMARAGGEIVGSLATAFAAPGSVLAKTPSGYLSHTAMRGVETARTVGGARGAAQAIAWGGIEGAIANAGSYLGQVAIEDRELTAEGMFGAAGTGFVFGSVAGGGMLGIEKGTIAARRMFSRTGRGEATKAAEMAENVWSTKGQEILDAHEITAGKARELLNEAVAARQQAVLARQHADAELAVAKLDAFKSKQAPTPESQPRAPQPFDTPTRAPEPPPTTVESPPLAGNEAELAQNLAEYESRRAAVHAWIDRLKNPRTKLDLQYSQGDDIGSATAIARGRSTKALDEDVIVEQSGGQIRTIGKGEFALDSITPNTRILARSNGPDFHAGAQLDEAYDDALELARLAEIPEDRHLALLEAERVEQQIHDFVRAHKPENAAVIDRIEQIRAQTGTSGYHAAEKRALKRAEREAAATPFVPPKARPDEVAMDRLFREQPQGPLDLGWYSQFTRGTDITDEIAQGAKIVGDYEQAAAKLTEAVGDLAHPAAREAAGGLRKAETANEARFLDREARAVDDAIDETAPLPKSTRSAPEPTQSPTDRLALARERKLAADVDVAKAKSRESELRIADKEAQAQLKGARAQMPKPAKSGASKVPDQPGQLSTLANMGAVLEVADTVGIPGLPKPGDLPIIGPLLGMYLKFRALKAVAGRMMGRVPATGEAKAATLAAKTQAKVHASIDRMLGLVERKAPKTRTVAVRGGIPVMAALEKRLFDNGENEPTQGSSLPELAAARAREVTYAAANPRLIIARVRKQLADVSDPDLIAAAEQHAIRQFQYLAKHAPKEPPPNPLAFRTWTPSQQESMSFARRIQAVFDPISVLQDVAEARLSRDSAEAIRETSPKLFVFAQERLLQRASDVKAAIPYSQRVRMSLLFDVPLDDSLDPARIASIQAAFASNSNEAPPQPGPQPMPSVASNVNLTALYQTPADRRALRR